MDSSDDSVLILDSDESEQNKRVDKRRSELFQRRSSMFTKQNITDDTDVDTDEEQETNVSGIESESKDSFDLQKYINSLKNEYDAWKLEYNARKEQRKLLEQQCASDELIEPDLSLLSESEREFVLARPNYEAIADRISELKPILLKIAQLQAEEDLKYNSLAEFMDENLLTMYESIAKSCLSKTIDKRTDEL